MTPRSSRIRLIENLSHCSRLPQGTPLQWIYGDVKERRGKKELTCCRQKYMEKALY
jgi:hypothetical protein